MQHPNIAAAAQNEVHDEAPDSDVAVTLPGYSSSSRELWWTGLLTLSCLFIVGLTVSELFYVTSRAELSQKQLQTGNAILSATRVREQKQLSEYRWVKKSEGVLRIPVARARELVIAEYARNTQAPDGNAKSSAKQATDGGIQ
jgi:hypothetical protein